MDILTKCDRLDSSRDAITESRFDFACFYLYSRHKLLLLLLEHLYGKTDTVDPFSFKRCIIC